MSVRGPYETGIARRREIVEAALSLFGEVGYRGASLRDIAARAGLSHTGLLRHFPKKELLLQSVLAERELRTRRDLDLETREPLQMLRNIVLLAEWNAHDRKLVELYCALSAEATTPSHPAFEYFVTRYRELRAHLRWILEELRQEGLMRDHLTPDAAAIAIIAHSDGLQLQWLLSPDEIDLAGETRRFLQSLVTVDLDSILDPLPVGAAPTV